MVGDRHSRRNDGVGRSVSVSIIISDAASYTRPKKLGNEDARAARL